ncbi:MAG: GAF domain-containing protein [Anaerolineales bacterium]|nr:GAF domain-containing protein [Anaerolineales bacterium]
MYKSPRLQYYSRYFSIDSENPDAVQRGRILQFMVAILYVGNGLRIAARLLSNLQDGLEFSDVGLFLAELGALTIFTWAIYQLINHGRMNLATHAFFLPLFLGELLTMFLFPEAAAQHGYTLLLYLASIATAVKFNISVFYILFCYIAAAYLQILNISPVQFIVSAMALILVAWISGRAQKNALKVAFKSTEKLEALNYSLQEKVNEQTADLLHRNERLQFSLDVGRVASASLNLDELLYNTAHLIRDEFGFYHVTIFLTDESDEFLILQEATGAIGQQQKEIGFRIKRDEHSIICWVAQHKQARIARNVQDDEFFQQHELLPNTRSELALPLMARNRLIGVIDVQSEQINSFSAEDITILQLMADQMANSIENALLFTELQEQAATLTELQLITGLMNQQPTMDSVLNVLAKRSKALLKADETGIFLWNEAIRVLESTFSLETAGAPQGTVDEELIGRCFSEGKTAATHTSNSSTVCVPIKERDTTIGVLAMVRQGNQQPFSTQEIQTLQLLATQAGTTITNQQLIEKTQEYVRRERTLNQVSAQVRNSLDTETILNSAAQQLGDILGNQRVRVRLFPQTAQPKHTKPLD